MYYSHSTVLSTKHSSVHTFPLGSILTPIKVTRSNEKQCCKDLLMLPSVGFFLQLFVSHLVRMVFVTNQATVPVILGGLAADAEQVNRGI